MPPIVPDFSLDALERKAVAAQKRRSSVVIALRVAIFVIVIGAWELAARVGWIDPFFFGKPSGVAQQIYEWFVDGTSQGPLWKQMLVTMEETLLGFAIGSIAGVICGIALGR